MAGMRWIGERVRKSSVEDAWAAGWGAGDDSLASGREDGVAVSA